MQRPLLLLVASSLALLACSKKNDGVTSGASGGHAESNAGRGGAAAGGGGHSAGASAGGGRGGAASGGPSAGGGPFGSGGLGGRAAGGRAGSSGTTAGGSEATAGDAGAGGEPAGGPNGDYWQPSAGLTWQWQLSESVQTILDVDVYDIDWESEASTVEALHARGIRVVCYVSVGSWEDFRPDADQFPAEVIGNDYDGWPGEKYLDIRSDAVKERMLARIDLCRSKGFDAIEPDNMDVFELGGDSGFPLTQADGVSYAKWLAEVAHARGLGIGQKNASGITASIESVYDWALTESCYSDGDWCGDVEAYVTHDKPVFMCEYEASSFAAACSAWKPRRYSPILKDLDLGAPVTFCP